MRLHEVAPETLPEPPLFVVTHTQQLQIALPAYTRRHNNIIKIYNICVTS